MVVFTFKATVAQPLKKASGLIARLLSYANYYLAKHRCLAYAAQPDGAARGQYDPMDFHESRLISVTY